MAITQDDVDHIASLARLGVSEEEKTEVAEKLSSILAYVAQLQEVDTKNVTPTYQVEGLLNIMDVDAVISADDDVLIRLLDAMPDKIENLLRVKGVFE